MKAARVYEPGKIVVENIPIPELGEKDVLIKIHRVGLCGTDAGVLHGYVPSKLPVTLGHEFSGTIVQLGSAGLGGFKEGDPVSAVGGWSCGTCEFCLRALPQHCKTRNALGRTQDGCIAEYLRMNVRAVHRLPSNVSFDEGQNFLNIANVVRAYKKVPLQIGKQVVVFGAGNVGLLLLQVLKAAGAYQVLVADAINFRLELAKKMGASHVVNVLQGDPVQKILEIFPKGVDVAYEATGNTAAFQSACSVIREMGALVSMGMFSKKAKELDLSFLYKKETIVYGSTGGEEGYQEALRLLEEKKLNITSMITHRFPIEETAKAFETFDQKDEKTLRILIDF